MARPKKDQLFDPNMVLNVLEERAYEAKVRKGEAVALYEEEPVDIVTFMRDKDYLGLKPIYDEHGNELPPLSEPQRQFIEVASDFNNGINHIILWVGKGGGKNWITRLLFMYLAYRLLVLKSPHRFLDFPETEYITFLNVAANEQQAKNNFFSYLRDGFRTAGDKAFKQFGFDPDRDIYKSAIVLPKKIQIISGNSDADSLEGLHILVGVADEIDGLAFKNPIRMWNMLISSSRSRFAGREKIIAISYSRYPDSNGMIQQLYEDYKGVQNAKVFRFPTWEFNPQRKKEQFNSDFEKDPDWANAVYACNPPSSSLNAWIKDAERIKASMKKGEEFWPLEFPPPPEDFYRSPMSEVYRILPDGETAELNPYDLPFKSWFRGIPGVEYMLVGDPAIGDTERGGDAYGIVLGHREVVKMSDGKQYIRPVIDFAFRFTGYMFEEREIQYEAIHNLIIKLTEELDFNIRAFVFDQPFAVELSQWVRKRYHDVYVERNRYATLDDYSVLRAQIFGEAPPSSGEGKKIENGGIDWYYHPILYWELKNLEVDGKRKRVDHKSNTSKDIADPVAVFTYYAIRKWPVVGVEISAGTLNPRLEAAKSDSYPGMDDELKETLKTIDKKKVTYRITGEIIEEKVKKAMKE